MNYTKIFFATFFSQSITLAKAQRLYPFSLEGTIKGKDSGYVYLNYSQTGDKSITDSCRLEKGHFVISGNISEPTCSEFSTFNNANPNSINDEKNSAKFYIEPNDMKLDAVIDQFNALKLAGSVADSDRMRLARLKMNINNIINPIKDNRNKYYQEYNNEQKKENDTSRLNMLRKKIDSLDDKLEPLYKKEKLIDSLFIVQNPNSYVAADRLWLFVQTKDISFPSLESLYIKFSKKIKESYAGKKIGYETEKEKNIQIGGYAKNFIAIDSRGDTINLTSYKGKKYVLLDFGASWCAPCRKLTPYLKMEYVKYDTALEVISIAEQDQVDDWRKAILDDKMEWPQIIENKKMMPIEPADRTVTNMYYIDLIPSLILIDKDSRIIGKYGGFYSAEPIYMLMKNLNKLFENKIEN